MRRRPLVAIVIEVEPREFHHQLRRERQDRKSDRLLSIDGAHDGASISCAGTEDAMPYHRYPPPTQRYRHGVDRTAVVRLSGDGSRLRPRACATLESGKLGGNVS